MTGKHAVQGVVAAVMLTGMTSSVFANGYKILGVKSAKATAMGEAFIVQADDPSAIAFNPAGIAQLNGVQVNVHATVCNGFTEYTSPSGIETDNKDRWQVVPSLFVTTDTGLENVTAGIGVSFPNGLSSDWGKDSFARYVTTYSQMLLADIAPTFGMLIGERLMIGGGINFYYSEVNLQSMADMGLAAGLPGMADVEKVLKGDGTAWGGNIGAIYKINERNSVAATCRFPFTVDYSGDLGLAGAKSPIDASLDFPLVAVLGYAFKPTAKCKVELNLDWTNWKAVDDTVITTQFPGLESIVYQWQLKNTMAYKIGTEYAYSDKLALRCGYIYNENATPAETWRPSLPDTDTHFFSAGFGYKMGDLTVDTAFLLIYYAKRDVSNNVDMNELLSSSSIDGTYRTWAPSVAVSATYKF